jgi:hypothetical protein
VAVVSVAGIFPASLSKYLIPQTLMLLIERGLEGHNNTINLKNYEQSTKNTSSRTGRKVECPWKNKISN